MSENFNQKVDVVKSIEFQDKKDFLERSSKSKNNFTIISRDLYQKSGLSLEALGLIGYLISLPSDWIVYVSQLKGVFKVGKNKILSIMKELSIAGYMQRHQVRDSKGRVSGWKTKYSDIPEYLNSHPELHNPALDNPKLDYPELVNTPLQNNNNTNKLKLIKKYNNNQKTKQLLTKVEFEKVVVSLKEKLKGLSISSETLIKWVKKYGGDYINEKIELTKNNSDSNPEGFLNKAITKNWKQTYKQQININQQSSINYPSHDENVIWFTHLSDEDKLKHLQIALNKYTIFKEHLRYQKISVLDTDFVSHNLFLVLMGLIGRAK